MIELLKTYTLETMTTTAMSKFQKITLTPAKTLHFEINASIILQIISFRVSFKEH